MGDSGPYRVAAPLTAGEAQAMMVPGSTAKGFYVEPLDPWYERGFACDKLRRHPKPEDIQ